ncbi:MAG: pentapeptide repeat-containing protein [Armatimonadota bacterium]
MISNPWEQKPVREVCEFIRGLTFSPSDVTTYQSDNNSACMRTKNVQSRLDLSDTIYVPRELVRDPKQMLRRGDMLISVANSSEQVGKCCLVEELPFEATLGGFIAAARADEALMAPRFLYYWLSSPWIQAKLRRTARKTTNIANLPLSDVQRLIMPVPPLAEQHSIVDILDAADEARRLRAEADGEMKRLIPALFDEMFGDPGVTSKQRELIECAHFVSGGTPSKTEPRYWSGNVPWVSPKDMKVEELWDAQDHINAEAVQSAGLKVIPQDSVLIVVRGMILAHTLPIGLNRVPVTINQDMKGLMPRSNVSPEFLQWALLAQRAEILRSVRTAAHGTKRLETDWLTSIRLHIPPRPLQRQFAAHVTEIRAIQDQQAKSREELDALFESLLHRALAGELTGGTAETQTWAGADMHGRDLTNFTLTGKTMRRANLKGSRLCGAMLASADLTEAVLEHADLSGANLADAQLGWTKLRGVNLQDANLENASLIGADLRDSSLVGCKLSGANLTLARLDNLDLSMLDLTNVNLRGSSRDGCKIGDLHLASAKRRPIWWRLSDSQRSVWSAIMLIKGIFEVKDVLDELRYYPGDWSNSEHIRGTLDLLVSLAVLIKVDRREAFGWRRFDPDTDQEVVIEDI